MTFDSITSSLHHFHMDYILGGALGGLVAFVFSIPAILLEWTSAGKTFDAPLVIDVKTIFGHRLKKSEVFLVGLLLYLLIGFLFGLVYVLFAERSWLFVTGNPYSAESWFVYGVLSWVVASVVIYPALGMGSFARKEGQNVWIETLVSHLLLGLALWLLVKYYQPFYFVV